MTVEQNLVELREKFVRAQLAGDRRSALALIVEGVQGGASITDLQAHVIGAAQQEIGRLWQANTISIAQEHLATGISQIALARLFDYAPHTVPNNKVVFIACVAGELHDLPARLVADYLDHAGFTVRYFGPDVPTYDLVAAIKATPPDLLALSVTMSFNVGALRKAVLEIREVVPKQVIAVGGHALQWSDGIIGELGVETAPSDPPSLVAMARRLTGAV